MKRDIAIVFLVSVLATSAVRAGNLDSPGLPGATGYTLSEIYARLTTGATATEGGHQFSPSADPASGLRTLKEIYDAIPTIEADKVKSGTSYLSVAGTLTPDGGTATVSDLFLGKTANLTGDWTPDSGSLNLACAVSTFNGTTNLVADGYDGTGNGTNRWCITNSGTAVADEILNGKIAWVDGVEITGTMDNIGTQNITPGTSSQTISQGYHSGTGTVAGDSDLIEGNIKSGKNIFGVAGNLVVYAFGDNDASKVAGTAIVPGTLLKNEYNGSAGSSVLDYASYPLVTTVPGFMGGVDDYNNSGTNTNAPANTYSSGTWIACGSGGCAGADPTNANNDKRDPATGLIWSINMDSANPHTWFWANNCYEPGDANNPGGVGGTCVNNGDNACICVKKTSVQVGCESLGDGLWRTPTQKELMQAYIDGSWRNLSSAGNTYWSATTYSNNTQYGWYVYLNTGYTNFPAKTNAVSSRVRCVR